MGALPVQSHVVGGWARGSVQGGASHVQGSGTPSHGASRTLTLSISPPVTETPGGESVTVLTVRAQDPQRPSQWVCGPGGVPRNRLAVLYDIARVTQECPPVRRTPRPHPSENK